jgi:hypothetical protein
MLRGLHCKQEDAKMRSLKKAFRSPMWLCMALLAGTSAHAATATVTLVADSTPSGPCGNLGPLFSVSGSGNQLIFPVTGSYPLYPNGPRASCNARYIVTLSGASVASVQSPTCPATTCTYTQLRSVSASGNQLTFPLVGTASYPGGPSFTFNTSYVVTLSGATATSAQGPVSPSGSTCNLGPFTSVTASGNQLTFPVSGQTPPLYPGGPGLSCSSSYIVTLY